jgi:beta-glucosidase
MRSRHCILPLLVLGFNYAVISATISGRVIDNSTPAIPIPNATVSLRANGSTTYTDSGGRFSLNVTTTNLPQPAADRFLSMQVVGQNLRFSSAATERVHIDLYDVCGRNLGALLDRTFGPGTHSVALPALLQKNICPGLCVLKIQKGGETMSASVMQLDPRATPIGVNGFGYDGNGPAPLGKTMAASDNLDVYRMAYTTQSRSVNPSTTQALVDIVLTRTAAEAAIERKIDSLMALPAFTTTLKAGQMTMARKNQLTNTQLATYGIGAVFNGGSDPEGDNSPSAWATSIDGWMNAIANNSTLHIPPLYGQDCVHGVGTIAGCTVFPHNIGLGCTHDTALMAKIGRIVAAEAAGCGIRLNFAPCIASPRNEKWGRTYEGFGETPEINSLMGSAYIRGLQGDGDLSKSNAVAACAKHYLGDGATTNGVNSSTANISDATMRAVHLPQYAACGRENMATVMPSYSQWIRNGQSFPQTTDSYTLTTILKNQLGFDGFYVSDWDAIITTSGCTSYSNSCIASAINAGLDMTMIVTGANATTYIQSIVNQADGAIPMSRINDAVRRILRIKFRMNLWNHPTSDQNLRAQINSAQSKATAREAVRKSLVLLKNQNNALPLLKTEKVVVVGSYANDMGAQCGGWTISWQGQTGNSSGIAGQTIFSGLQSVGGASNVTFDQSGSNLSSASKVVVVVGESPYAEGSGDNINSLDLTNTNGAGSLITTCHNSGKPVIVVLLSGRPMIIDGEIANCDAFVAAWLPGAEGGGIADVLYNDYNFTGTLTNTWPASYAQIPINTGPTYADEQHGSGGASLFDYGFGLKY